MSRNIKKGKKKFKACFKAFQVDFHHKMINSKVIRKPSATKAEAEFSKSLAFGRPLVNNYV